MTADPVGTPSSTRPGARAHHPGELPVPGWRQVLVRTKDEVRDDRVGLMAAGVAFYAMLALFPALIAAVTLWGLVADPSEIQQTIDGVAGALPAGAAELVTTQLSRIADTSSQALGWTFAVSLVAALWSASSGTKGLMNAVNAAYDEPETRGFVRVRGLALALTIGLIFFGLLVVGLIAAVPVLLDQLGWGDTGRTIAAWGRWPLLVLALLVGLGAIYRFAPNRDQPRWRWLGVGTVVAVVIWLLASVGFAWYVENFGSFGETYGSLAGVIVLMLWFFLASFAILFGAELNAEVEHQTDRDSTRGAPQPMGQRGAHVADTPPPEA
jgi:membrane protein